MSRDRCERAWIVRRRAVVQCRLLLAFVMVLVFAVTTFVPHLAYAANGQGKLDHDLYPGDFDGDGKDDVLYVASKPGGVSGIIVADKDGTPDASWQSWPSNYLGIPWTTHQYIVHVADFNGDGRADIFLQRAVPGDHYLLLADAFGRITSISQAIADNAFGLNWSAEAHRLIAADYSGDGRADLFFQAIRPSGLHALVLADTHGIFAESSPSPAQAWTDQDWPVFNWSKQDSLIFSGDFNGDGRSDLLIQPRFDRTDNLIGIVFSQGGPGAFQQSGVELWDLAASGVDASSDLSRIVVGDFNADGRQDILLQGSKESRANYVLNGNARGRAFSLGDTGAAQVHVARNAARLQASRAVAMRQQATADAVTPAAKVLSPATAAAIVPATAVGHTVGAFSVSNLGVANYSIPLVVPAGVAGMQPALSLNYQSSMGNGLLGIGWGLGGLSEIERCKKTLAQDNSNDSAVLSLADRFCLDGNKLRLISGTYGAAGSTYQTEIDTFSRVSAFGTAGNGPAYFVVEAKNGTRYEYGSSADSRIEAVNVPLIGSTPHTWALNKVSDRHGNTMTVAYQEDGAPNGSYRPVQITYTSNSAAGLAAAYRVLFFWEARPSTDILKMYVAGGAVTELYRLSRIETQYNDPAVGGWRLVRNYQLTYNLSSASGRSRLAAVQECAGDGTCLAASTFNWQEGTAGWSATERLSTGDDLLNFSQVVDLDGDGREDLVFPSNSGGVIRWCYKKSSTNGEFEAPQCSAITAGTTANPLYAFSLPINHQGIGRRSLLVSIAGNANLQLLGWNGSGLALTATSLQLTLNGRQRAADFDGDGRDDLFSATPAGAGLQFLVYRNNGNGFDGAVNFHTEFVDSNTSVGSFSGPSASRGREAFTDFNGDARADLLLPYREEICEEDGCYEMVAWRAYISTGSSFVQTGVEETCDTLRGLTCPTFPLVADVNGDGYSDAIFAWSSSQPWLIRYGSGAGLSDDYAESNLVSGFYNSAFATDYDGDDRWDILYPRGTTWWAAISNGSGFSAFVDTGIALIGSNNGSLRILDANGDGLQDIGYRNGDFRLRLRNGIIPDLLNSISDGYGNSVAITYAPLTDSSVYTKGSGAQYPKADVLAPMQVVKKYDASDGLGSSYTVSEKYAGLRVDLRGRGMLGFASRESIDGRSGIRSTWSFDQDYPYIGLVTESATYQSSSGPVIARLTNTKDELPVQGTQFNERRFPYIRVAVQDSYEVGNGNAAVSRTTTVTALDGYANPTRVEATTLDLTGSNESFTSTTINSYVPADTANWCVDLVSGQTITNTVPGQAAQTRTAQYIKDSSDPAKCRISQHIVEPNDSAIKVTRTFGYDVFGHPSIQTVTAANVAARTVTTNYGAQGVFPVAVTAQLSAGNQTSLKTYDYALGVPLTATDPNTLMTRWEYDGFGRLRRETRPDGTRTAWAYSACGSANGFCGDSRLRYQVQEQELDATAAGSPIRTSLRLFDSMGRAVYEQSQTLAGALATVRTHYDNQGRIQQRSEPYFSGAPAYYTTFSYDLLGRTIAQTRQVSESITGTQSTTFGYNRLIHTHTDANGKLTSKQFNAVGQVARMVDAAGGVTRYEYDPFGNLTRTTDPAGNQIVNTFNIRGFKLATQDPDMGAWSYTYYPTGELWTQRDAKNQTVTFTYDELSRPRTRVEPEGTTAFEYGASASARNIGKLALVTAPGGYSETYGYDSLGRVQDITMVADATSFLISSSYSAVTGLLDTTTYPASTTAVPGSRFKVQYEYAYGMLKRTRDFNAPGTVYWEQVASNAAGQAIDELYGNGLHTYSTYDAITGLLSYRTAGASSQVQDLAYQWDKAGNLARRNDSTLNLTEDFYYDDLNRLDYVRFNGVATPSLDVNYDATGNITSKSGVGSYAYPAPGASAVRPHAVSTAGASTYSYDANGNMTSRNGSPIAWYSYNLPSRIDKGSNYSQFYYGPSRQRYKQVASIAAGGSLPAGVETTWYAGGLFEKVNKPSGVVEYKHYIMAGNEAIAMRTLRSNNSNDTRYLHKDHLGSVDAITNEAGAVIQRLSYDAFGKRRNSQSWAGGPSSGEWTAIAAISHRGFTFHEQLDHVDLIHMNGRVYDPDIGRFISADPLVQSPLMSQSLNRYSYVMNNPLSLVDPSGYSWLSKAFKSIGNFFKKYWREIVAVVVTVVSMGTLGPAIGGFWGAVASGAMAGAIYGATVTALYGGNLGDIFRGALTGAVAGGIAAGIGYAMGQLFGTAAQPGATESSIDFGWESLGPGASPEGPLANAANSGISPAVLDGISGARRVETGRRSVFSGPDAAPADPTDGGTQQLFKACNGGSQEACTHLAARNQADLATALQFIEARYPQILAPFEGKQPGISFDTSREFWAARAGTTAPFSGNITLSAGYNSTADLVGTVSHELQHATDGAWGRAVTNFQDRFLPPIPPRNVGLRHTEIYILSDEVVDAYRLSLRP